MASEADKIVSLYQRHAAAWAADRGKHLTEGGWLDRFRALLPPTEPTVLDLGCGSGDPVARYLIEQGCKVSGVDSAPEMITMCAASLPGSEWLVADMRSLTLSRTFNGILAWDSFFHLAHDEQRRMFKVFRQHSRARAAVMFTSGTSYGEAIGSFRGEALYHASLDPTEYHALFRENGFDVMEHAVEDPLCGGRTVWLAQLS